MENYTPLLCNEINFFRM